MAYILAIRFVAIVSLGGAALGAASILASLGSFNSWLVTGVALAGLAIYSLGFYGGVLLIEKRLWTRSLMWYWAIQVPTFFSDVIGFQFTSLFHFRVGTIFYNMSMFHDWAVGSNITFALLNLAADQTPRWGVNLFALAGLFCITQFRNRPSVAGLVQSH